MPTWHLQYTANILVVISNMNRNVIFLTVTCYKRASKIRTVLHNYDLLILLFAADFWTNLTAAKSDQKLCNTALILDGPFA